MRGGARQPATGSGHNATDTRWHLYSSQPSAEMAYTPTELYLIEDESKGVQKVGSMKESTKPVEEEDEVMGGTVRYFKEHTVTFSQAVKVTSKNPTLVAEVYGQYCLSPEEGGMCKPLRLPFSWTFTAEIEREDEIKEGAIGTDPKGTEKGEGGGESSDVARGKPI